MPFSLKVVLSSIVSLVIAAAVFVPHSPAYAAARASLPYNATANGPYTVQGNKIVGADGNQYIFHGVGRDNLEYHCLGDSFLSQQYLAYMGSATSTGTGTYWDANTVRLPISEWFWLYGDVAAPGSPPPAVACSSSYYQALVKQIVESLTSLKLNVILDLQWSDAIDTSGHVQSWRGGGPWSMPDSDSIKFWQQVASLFSGYSNVLFEVFNEPHPPGYLSPGAWSCWAKGCTVTSDNSYSDDCTCMKTLPQPYQGIGMQALINAVRNVGANNLVLVGGIDWAYNLSQIGNPAYALSGSNLVYDTHPYSPYPEKVPSTWDAAFGNVSATYPVISAENGQYDCGSSYMSQLLPYLDAHQIGWVAWAWVVSNIPCAYPQLISDYLGTPASVNAAATYIYQYLHSYASTSGSMSKTHALEQDTNELDNRRFIELKLVLVR
jgi:endoglucanase